LVSILCVAAVFGLIGLLSREREPRYQGRTLSQWWVIWSDSVDGPQESPARAEEAAQAIRHIGTNAIPLLLKQVRRIESPVGNALFDLAWKFLPRPIFESRIVSSVFSGGHDFDPSATFYILGSQAAPAVPGLTSLMYSPKNSGLAHYAAYCLAAIGKEGLPSLVAALDKPQLPCCREAAFLLGVKGPPFTFGTNIALAVPALAKRAGDKDPDLAAAAIRALGHIRLEPQIAVPALTNSLRSKDPRVRQTAIRSLARFGEATSLLTALSDSDESVRRTATNCLGLIAPGTLTNVPVK